MKTKKLDTEFKVDWAHKLEDMTTLFDENQMYFRWTVPELFIKFTDEELLHKHGILREISFCTDDKAEILSFSIPVLVLNESFRVLGTAGSAINRDVAGVKGALAITLVFVLTSLALLSSSTDCFCVI